MPLSLQDIDSFHEFATQHIQAGTAETFDELYILWQSQCERGDVNQQIEIGLDDITAGRTQLADEAMEEIRAEFGLTDE